MTIEIEPDGESRAGACADCGASTRRVWGYAYVEGHARAVYFLTWTEGHQERGVSMLISIGAWGEGTGPGDRRAFGVECRLLDTGPAFMLVDAHDSGRGEHLGRRLTRAEALADEHKPEVFAILEQLFADEPRFREFLAADAGPSTT